MVDPDQLDELILDEIRGRLEGCNNRDVAALLRIMESIAARRKPAKASDLLDEISVRRSSRKIGKVSAT